MHFLVSDYAAVLAPGYAALGDAEKALNALEMAILDRSQFVFVSLQYSPFWDPLRQHSRFNELLALADSMITHTPRYLENHRDQIRGH